jgi:hypothetical protein
MPVMALLGTKIIKSLEEYNHLNDELYQEVLAISYQK